LPSTPHGKLISGAVSQHCKATGLKRRPRCRLESMRLSVHADVASDYLQLRALDSEEEIAGEEVAADQESLKLTEVQFEAKMLSGQMSRWQRHFSIPARAQADDIGIQRALFEHAIATLTGTTASSFTLESNAQLSPLLRSQLVYRRSCSNVVLMLPAAERRVAEANARIGVHALHIFLHSLSAVRSISEFVAGKILLSGPSW